VDVLVQCAVLPDVRAQIGGLMRIEYTSSARHGECAECGKRFTRRAIDANDDGRLCRDCYLKQREVERMRVRGLEVDA
jgi:hypothetical protein